MAAKRSPCKRTWRKRPISSAVRRSQEGVRPARHPGQQRGDLRFRAARRGQRGAFPQAFRSQRARLDPGHGRSGQAVRPGRRQHRQHQLRRLRHRISRHLGLQRHEGAVDAITRSLAKERRALRNIRVNSVNPGMVETEGLHSAGITDGAFRNRLKHRRRWGPNRPAERHRSRRGLPGLARFGDGPPASRSSSPAAIASRPEQFPPPFRVFLVRREAETLGCGALCNAPKVSNMNKQESSRFRLLSSLLPFCLTADLFFLEVQHLNSFLFSVLPHYWLPCNENQRVVIQFFDGTFVLTLSTAEDW